MDGVGMVLALAIVAAIAVVTFWRVILTMLLVGLLAVVFAGLFGIAVELSRFTGG